MNFPLTVAAKFTIPGSLQTVIMGLLGKRIIHDRHGHVHTLDILLKARIFLTRMLSNNQ